MNVPKVAKGLIFGLSICTLGVLGGLTLKENQDKSNKKISESMEYVKTNAPDKYQRLVENNGEKYLYSADKEKLWKSYANNIKDSLRIDSTAKANYAKGLQMAQDSLKTKM